MAKKKEIKNLDELKSIDSSELMNQVDEVLIGANDLNDDHKVGIKIAAEFMRRNGLGEASEDLLHSYEMNPIPIFPIEESEFCQRMQQEGINVSIQGYMKVGINEEAIRYPIIILSGDVMRFECMFQKLKHDLKNELQSESN